MRVTCPSTKSCTAGTDSRVYAPCWPRVFGKLQDQLVKVPKFEQKTFEQLQVVDVLAFGEVKLVAQERVQQRVGCMKRVPKIVLQDRDQRWYAEQSAEFPASQDMKEPVCTAGRCGAGRRLSWRITCRRGAGKSLIWMVACRRDVGRSSSMTVTCPSKKSCVAGTDSRLVALWMTCDCGQEFPKNNKRNRERPSTTERKAARFHSFAQSR